MCCTYGVSFQPLSAPQPQKRASRSCGRRGKRDQRSYVAAGDHIEPPPATAKIGPAETSAPLATFSAAPWRSATIFPSPDIGAPLSAGWRLSSPAGRSLGDAVDDTQEMTGGDLSEQVRILRVKKNIFQGCAVERT